MSNSHVVVGRIPAFQTESPDSIPCEVRVFLYLGTMFILFVVFYVVSSGGPDIVLITDPQMRALMLLSGVLDHSLWLPYRYLAHVSF